MPTEEHSSLKIKGKTCILLGSPATVAANLLQMSKFRGTGAESLKIGIDSIFSKKGTFEIKHYTEKVVSITTDGASVNTSQYNGLMTEMKKIWQDWLLSVQCVNHRVELAMKDAFDKGGFNEINKLYLGIYNICKNSVAIKISICEAAETLNISVYSHIRLTGTQFHIVIEL